VKFKTLLAVLTLVAIEACSLLPVAPAANTAIRTVPATASPSVDFELSGRIAVKFEQQNFSGGIRWRHRANRNEIFLLSPLGQAVAEIRNDDIGAVLITSAHKIYRANNVEELTKTVLGWRLPVDGLPYWVRGVSAPPSESTVEEDAAGKIVSLQQDGWAIRYTGHAPTLAADDPDQRNSPERPKTLVLTRDQLHIRLVVDAWGE